MEKQTIVYDSRGATGNIFWLLGELRQIMRKQRRYTAFNEIRDRVVAAGSYNEALQIMSEEVTLVDRDKQ